MIRINLTDQAAYFRLRKEFLKRIAKYVDFDQADICLDSSQRTGKTEKAAENLKENFPALYHFLFDESGNLREEKLTLLLAGPDLPPQSFGGGRLAKSSMREYLEEIIDSCGCVCTDEAAKNCCKEIFHYEKFVRDKEDAYWLLRKQNVRVCPYCNRIYTVTLPSKEELEKGEEFTASRATLDHFYSQGDYPYLSVSLFNLIVSCYSCNLSKGSHQEQLVYPYDEEFGKEAVFRLIPELPEKPQEPVANALNYLHGDNERFYIKLMAKETTTLQKDISLEERLSGIDDKGLQKRIINSIRIFHLEELYKEHKMEIMDVLRNQYYFDEHYVRTSLSPLIRKKMEKLNQAFDSEEMVYDIDQEDLEIMAKDMLFFSRTRQAEWGKRPLAKLISDILDQVSALDNSI